MGRAQMNDDLNLFVLFLVLIGIPVGLYVWVAL
jgi:hypothetical protein